MYRDSILGALLATACVVALTGCDQEVPANNSTSSNNSAQNAVDNAAPNNTANSTPENNQSPNNGDKNNTSENSQTENSDPDPPEPVEALVPSQRPRVKFKGGARWSTDLSRSLDIRREELCKELGEYDCVSVVHKITLGGVEPYSMGIDKPVEIAPVIAPLATDRVALSACDIRAERDLEDLSSAVLFKEMPAEGEPSAEQLEAMGTRLVERLLRREAKAGEVGELVAFWEEVKADSDDPRRDWATLSCFALATSVESLFY